MLQDLRYAVRRVVQGRAWTAVVLLSLALGIGASTALFSLVEAVLLRDLPVPRAGELVYLNWQSGRNAMLGNLTGNSDFDESTGLMQSTSFSTLTFDRIRSQSRTLSAVFAFAQIHGANLSAEGQAEIADGQFVSGNYFDALGLRELRGRGLTAADDQANATPAAVISDRLWLRRFARDRNAIGKTITVNGLSFSIVGVTPPDFNGTLGFSERSDFYLPLAFESRLFPDDEHALPWSWWLRIMGRTVPAVTRQHVQAELEGIFQGAARDGWSAAPSSASARSAPDLPRLEVFNGSRGLADQVRYVSQLMITFTAIVGVLLLIVCVNVANMSLARAASRQREIGVRRAIGASRTRLVRLLLTENLILCLIAGGLALLCAAWGIDLVELFVSQTVGTTVDLRVDLRAFTFAIFISLLTGAVVGLLPALQVTRLDIVTHMRQAAPGVLGKRSRLSQPLLVAQLALSLVLLVAAGLLGQSVRRMQRFDVGFDPRNLLLFSLDPESVGYDDTRTIALYEQLTERLEAVPGVRSATTSEYPLVSSSGSGNSIHVQGSTLRPNQGRIRRMKIRSNFLQAMGVPVVQGRDLTPRDNQSAPQVALINQTLARQFFPNANPIGRRFGFGSAERSGDIEIVGVVRDAAIDEIREETPPTVFVPYLQRVHGAGVFIVRTTAAPLRFVPTIQEMVRQVAPDVPAIGFHTQQQQVRTSFVTERALANTSTLFSAIALLLACIGLYGMMTYNVARRSSEIAIRMALGARSDGVVWLVLREVVGLITIGVAIGLAAAFAVTRTLAALLYELTPNDPLTIAAAVLLLCLVGVLAGYLPARRAARVQPWSALRYE